MAFATEFHMPGAYFDPATPAATGQPLSATMFRPPMSPSASSSVYNLAKSTGSLYSDVSMANNNTPSVGAKRKRTRAEVSRASTPNADWNMNMDGACDPREEETPARQQQLNTAGGREIRYTLAGQIDTPSGPPPHTTNGILEDSVYSDIDYRRALGSKRPHDDLDSPSTAFSGLRLETPNAGPVTPRQVGWSSLALSTIGGVVGKVWEFCKAGGFRGFQAGGGERYAIGTPSKGGQQWCNEHDVPTLEVDADEHNVPGGFPQSEYVSLHELSTPDSTPRPAVKRRQTSATNGEELRRNWVIVDQPSPSASSPSQQQSLRPSTTFTKPSSTRPSLSRPGPHAPRYSTPTTSSSSSRRISVPKSRLSHNNNNNTPSAATRTRNARNRISHAGSPALSAREPASYAAPRSPSSLSVSHNHNNQTPGSPSRIPLPTNPANGSAPNPFAIPGTSSLSLPRPSSRASLSRCASPAPLHQTSSSSHKRNASTASASGKSGRRSAEGMVDSPRLTAEAKQLAAKKLAAERDADAKMEAFNRRLMDMIRQGKEALGTTVEVDMEAQGELGMPTAGWEDDD
ncbi:hypothetical protein GE09DRAFT_148711 [Coniochaeta sp. 2T2.1]|nr:hypothetical protein GE09DRAFT_148711 [Coniochaeta sp. 2T2.1]